MTPREVDQLDGGELRAFWEHLEATERQIDRDIRAAKRRR